MVDGGNINQILLMLGFNSYSDFGKTEHPMYLKAEELIW
jgi:hypothetical protein